MRNELPLITPDELRARISVEKAGRHVHLYINKKMGDLSDEINALKDVEHTGIRKGEKTCTCKTCSSVREHEARFLVNEFNSYNDLTVNAHKRIEVFRKRGEPWDLKLVVGRCEE